MPSTREIIQAEVEQNLIDENRKPVLPRLLPDLTREELMSLGARWLCRHRTMSATFRSSVRAWKGMLEQIDFPRRSVRDGWKDVLLPYRHPTAHDGCANFWVVDPQLGSDNWGPIYFCCHDAPVMLFEAAPLQQFVWAKRSKNTPRGTRVCIQARHRKHLTRACRPRTAMRVDHEYSRCDAWAYIAALDVHHARVFGRCEPKTGTFPLTAWSSR